MISKTVSEFVFYAKTHLYLEEDDALYFTNQLLHHFGESVPFADEIDETGIAGLSVPDQLVEHLVSDLSEKGVSQEESLREADYVLGLLSPRPSAVNAVFSSLLEAGEAKEATEYLYRLGVDNYYYQKTNVDKNIVWDASYPDGPSLRISINLSKPEKSNKDIAKLVKSAPTGYPKCALCLENLGYYGDERHAARSSIRMVPITLAGEGWHLQYSPYGYYDRHCIAFKDEHTPMKIERKTFERQLDFVDLFPHFFIGSNSDLPIVGGSILNHQHFQGGGASLPLFEAPNKRLIKRFEKGSELHEVDFYISCLKLVGSSREEIVDIGDRILSTWRNHDDSGNEIISHDETGLHNTITTFTRKIGGHYEVYLALRNNRCDERYPDGIFHAHPEYHAIKKEGIGLIEAAGLFILPARLKRQMQEVEEAVALPKDEYLAKYPDLALFESMIETMKKDNISAKTYVNRVCQGILRNVAVYKDTPQGQAGLEAFLKEAFPDD